MGGGDQKKLKSFADSLPGLYICAVLAACHTEIYTIPLDVVKTRLQIQGAKADKVGVGPQQGMLKTGINIVKEEGVLSLWSGISPMWLRHSIYSGTRIVVYNEIREFFRGQNADGKLKTWQLAFSGVMCGFIAQFVSSPADLIKVQFQMEGKRKRMGLPPRVTSLWGALSQVYAAGGIRGMWVGWIPNVQRAILVNLGDFTTYDLAKQYIQKHTNISDNLLLHALSSFCAGFTAATLSTPADVLKSRLMNQPVGKDGKGLLYKGTWDCAKKTISEEGFLAMYKGFFPSWIRLGPWALIYWIGYEQLRILIGGKNF